MGTVTRGAFVPINERGQAGDEIKIGVAGASGIRWDALDVDPAFSAPELTELCRCGHDRGDHLDDAPHACDVRRVHDDGQRELVDVCVCRAFEAARMTSAMRAELARPCACGHLRASHDVDSPHACLEGCGCRSFTAAEPLAERR